MNCAFDKEKLSGYYDGELDAAEKAEVERHIASCSECLRELGELKSAAVLVKELPRLRAPRSIAEGVSAEIRRAGQVHQFARVRRTLLWVSAAAALLLVGVNVVYFSNASKSPETSSLAQQEAAAPVARMAPPPLVTSGPAADENAARRNTLRDEDRAREARKAVEEQKELGKKADMPEAGQRGKDRGDGLVAKPAPEAPKPEPKPGAAAPPPAPPAAERPAPAKPMAPPAPLAKAEEKAKPAPVPAEPAPADKAAPGKDAERLGRTEQDTKTRSALHGEGAPAAPTHLTLATTQVARSRPQMEEALRKMGVALPAPPPGVKGMKAPPRETEQTYTLELTDAQIARLRQELEKPGASRLLTCAPGDPVLAEFKTGLFAGGKKEAAATGGAGAPKEDSKAKDLKETEDAAPAAAPAAKAPAETFAMEKKLASSEPRRKVVLHLLEVPFIPDRQPAADSLKK